MKYRKKEWLVELAEIAILVVALMLLATGLGRASAQIPASSICSREAGDVA